MTAAEQALTPVRTVRRIQPSRGLIHFDAAEVWRFRELLYILIWRDVKARYKQTFLGAFWAIFRPFVSMIIFTVIFGHLVGVKPGTNVPYPVFVFAGLAIWTYFASAVGQGAGSLLSSGALVTKAYFPRLYIPLAAVAAPLVDFALSFILMLGLFAWYLRAPSWHIVFLPLFLVLTLLIAMGLGLWLAPMAVRYRDLAFALPFILQLWMYATPVIYPASLVPKDWRWLISLNPLAGATEGFRWTLLSGPAPSALALVLTATLTIVLILTGLIRFTRAERTFADLI